MTDHHAALNNGAFFIANTKRMHSFVHTWKRVNSIKAYPFTDNGSMLVAILHFFFNDKTCDHHSTQLLRCVHNRLDARMGTPAKPHRNHNGLRLVYPTDGFNNHFDRLCLKTRKCDALDKYGWHIDDLYKPGMFAQHTKSTGQESCLS